MLAGWDHGVDLPILDVVMTVLRSVDVFAMDKKIKVTDVAITKFWANDLGVGFKVEQKPGAASPAIFGISMPDDDYRAFKLEMLAQFCMEEEGLRSLQDFLRILDMFAERLDTPTYGLFQHTHAFYMGAQSLFIPLRDNLIEFDMEEYQNVLDRSMEIDEDGRRWIHDEGRFS